MALSSYGIEALDDWPVNKVFCDTYEGNDANNRELDLGDDYDLVLIFLEESMDGGATHLALAHAVKTTYGFFYHNGAATETRHNAMAAGNGGWQGKMTGGDADKIKLGSVGAAAEGTNKSGWTYRILALKFGTVNTF